MAAQLLIYFSDKAFYTTGTARSNNTGDLNTFVNLLAFLPRLCVCMSCSWYVCLHICDQLLVCTCQSVSEAVSLCQRLSVCVRGCQSGSEAVSLCQRLSVCVRGCQSVSEAVSLCQRLSVCVRWAMHMKPHCKSPHLLLYHSTLSYTRHCSCSDIIQYHSLC